VFGRSGETVAFYAGLLHEDPSTIAEAMARLLLSGDTYAESRTMDTWILVLPRPRTPLVAANHRERT